MYFFRGRPAGGRVSVFCRGWSHVCIFVGGAGWLGPCVYFFRGRGRVSIFISQILPARAVLVFLRFEIKILNTAK